VKMVTWAEQQGIPTVRWGDMIDRINIQEENRATVWEFRRAGIEGLLSLMQKAYTSKGIGAVLVGIERGEQVGYAVFVEDDFLTDVGEEF